MKYYYMRYYYSTYIYNLVNQILSKIINFLKVISSYNNPYITIKETFFIIFDNIRNIPLSIKKDINAKTNVNINKHYLNKISYKYIIDDKVKKIREQALNYYDSTITPFNITEEQINRINLIKEK